MLNIVSTTASKFAPLDSTLGKMRAASEWYAASAGPIDDWMGWTSASVYACNDFAAFQPKLDEALRGPVPNKRIQGYGLFGTYAWLIVESAVACYLFDRRMPDLTPGAIAFRTCKHESGEDMTELRYLQPGFYCLPGDHDAGHAHATVVPDEAALRDLFHWQLEAHLPPVMGVIEANTGHPMRLMWAQASDWVVESLIHFTKDSRDREQLEWLVSQFAQRDGSPLKVRNAGVIPLHFDDPVTGVACTEYMADRASCCQWYRYPDAKGDRCSTCPGRPRQQRIDSKTTYYREERAKLHATQRV
jgi:hypothetical protein